MRRLLAVCAVTVMIYAAFAAAQRKPAGTVMAAGGSGFGVQAPDPPGCPIGSGAFVFCSLIPSTSSSPEQFTVDINGTVDNPSVGLVPAPGLAADFAAGDFAISNNTCSGNFVPGTSCTFDVAFSPTTAGLRAAEITFNGQNLIIVEGTGATLVMAAPATPVCTPSIPSDDAFMYCPEALGAASGAQTFTLTSSNAITGLNITLAPVAGLASEFSALHTDFVVESSTCAGTLGAGASCTVSVAFMPETAGLREAALTAADSEGDSAAVLTLAGGTTTGLAITLPSLVPGNCGVVTDFVFCNEPTGGSTAVRAYTLTNTSGAQVTGLTITPPLNTTQPPPPPVNFSVTSTSCPTTLAAGASCTINVAFTPQGTGLQQGSVVVTDTAGDVGAINLAGTGDDFNMQIVAGQSNEVTVAQGDTATFMAQLTSVGAFGQNGEMVTLVCPIDLPQFTTCAYEPCPVIPVVGGNAPFSILIATSTANVLTPPISNPCNSPAAAGFLPGLRGPNGILRIVTNRPERAPQFPAPLVVLATIALGLAAFGYGAMGALPKFGSGARRMLMAFGIIVLSGACGGGYNGNGSTSTATPIATTTMNVVASAVDSSGNSMNASRSLQIVLDVIKPPHMLP